MAASGMAPLIDFANGLNSDRRNDGGTRGTDTIESGVLGNKPVVTRSLRGPTAVW